MALSKGHRYVADPGEIARVRGICNTSALRNPLRSRLTNRPPLRTVVSASLAATLARAARFLTSSSRFAACLRRSRRAVTWNRRNCRAITEEAREEERDHDDRAARSTRGKRGADFVSLLEDAARIPTPGRAAMTARLHAGNVCIRERKRVRPRVSRVLGLKGKWPSTA